MKKDNLSKRINQLMWKSISLYISKPVYRPEYNMDKFILKIIVIFSGILTGNASATAYRDFSRYFYTILKRYSRLIKSTISFIYFFDKLITMLSPLKGITGFKGRREGYRRKYVQVSFKSHRNHDS